MIKIGGLSTSYLRFAQLTRIPEKAERELIHLDSGKLLMYSLKETKLTLIVTSVLKICILMELEVDAK